jgi:hypothetical protein
MNRVKRRGAEKPQPTPLKNKSAMLVSTGYGLPLQAAKSIALL